MRARLVAHLSGAGLELGPGHQPFEVPEGLQVALVDQWVPAESRALFYELDETVSFPVPDIVSNLDTDRLSMVGDDSQDFVIASHILEHLADPIGMIGEIHRVLRPGGVLLALLPDRRRTFDRTRYGTPLEHLVAEHEAGTIVVDDAHIVEFIVHADHLMRREEGTEPEPMTQELIDAHRLRSIHAHCWTEDEFLDVVVYCVRDRGLGLTLVDGFSSRAGRGGWEFGLVLRKEPLPVSPPWPDATTEAILAAWGAVTARQAAVDRWPVGEVLAAVLDERRDLSPSEVGAVAEVIDVVLHRADLEHAFASNGLDLDRALGWAAGVAAGAIVDSSAPRLEPHRLALERWA
jgi:SAM-dependent methyltransferase